MLIKALLFGGKEKTDLDSIGIMVSRANFTILISVGQQASIVTFDNMSPLQTLRLQRDNCPSLDSVVVQLD